MEKYTDNKNAYETAMNEIFDAAEPFIRNRTYAGLDPIVSNLDAIYRGLPHELQMKFCDNFYQLLYLTDPDKNAEEHSKKKKWGLIKNDITFPCKDKNKIEQGCTASIPRMQKEVPELLLEFDNLEDAQRELSKYTSEIELEETTVGSYWRFTEYSIEELNFDENGEWMPGGDIWAFSEIPVTAEDVANYIIDSPSSMYEDGHYYAHYSKDQGGLNYHGKDWHDNFTAAAVCAYADGMRREDFYEKENIDDPDFMEICEKLADKINEYMMTN